MKAWILKNQAPIEIKDYNLIGCTTNIRLINILNTDNADFTDSHRYLITFISDYLFNQCHLRSIIMVLRKFVVHPSHLAETFCYQFSAYYQKRLR